MDGAPAAMLPVVVKPATPARRSNRMVPPLPVLELELRRGVLRVHGADPALVRMLIDALST